MSLELLKKEVEAQGYTIQNGVLYLNAKPAYQFSYESAELPHCCGIHEVGNLYVSYFNNDRGRWTLMPSNEYAKKKSHERNAILVLIASVLLNIYNNSLEQAQDKNEDNDDDAYSGHAPLAFGTIFSTNGHYCSKFVEEAAELVPSHWKIASETGNANSGNTVRLYVAQF